MWAVNNSRNLALKLSAILTEETALFSGKMLRLYLEQTFKKRRRNQQTTFEDIVRTSTSTDLIKWQILFHKINELYNSKKITGDQLIILNHEIQSSRIFAACRHIKTHHPLFL
jgi:putative membrane protein